MDGLEGMEEDLEIDAVFDGKPVELQQNGGNVTNGGGSGDDTGSSVLDQLQFMEEFVGESKEKGIAIIQAGRDQRVDQDSGAVRSE